MNICNPTVNHSCSKRYTMEIVFRVSIARLVAFGHGQSCYSGDNIAILLDCEIEILSLFSYSDTSCTFIC